MSASEDASGRQTEAAALMNAGDYAGALRAYMGDSVDFTSSIIALSEYARTCGSVDPGKVDAFCTWSLTTTVERTLDGLKEVRERLKRTPASL